MRPLADEVEAYGTGRPLDMEYADRKIALPEGFVECPSFPVRKYHIDTNEHVNNCQYVQMALEALEEEPVVARLRVEYKKSAVCGDIIVPHEMCIRDSFKGAADCFLIFLFGVDDVHADAGAAGTGLDHQRQIVAQFLKRGVFGLGDQRSSPGSRDPGHLEDLLGGQLVHGKRTAKGIRACVADTQDINCLLYTSRCV